MREDSEKLRLLIAWLDWSGISCNVPSPGRFQQLLAFSFVFFLRNCLASLRDFNLLNLSISLLIILECAHLDGEFSYTFWFIIKLRIIKYHLIWQEPSRVSCSYSWLESFEDFDVGFVFCIAIVIFHKITLDYIWSCILVIRCNVTAREWGDTLVTDRCMKKSV